MFSPGTIVELCSKRDEGEVVWVPALVYKEFKENDEYRYIVKDKPLIGRSYKSRPSKTVDLRSLRPIPPPIRVKEYRLDEYIEVYHDGIGWRQGRVVKSEGGVMGSLFQNWCTLLLEATKKQLMFKQSDLRPLRVWEDGVWKVLHVFFSLLSVNTRFLSIRSNTRELFARIFSKKHAPLTAFL